MSLRTLFDPQIAGDFAVSLNLRLGDDPFRVEVADGAIETERGEGAAPDATIETDPGTLIALVHGRRELAEALSAGDIEIEGDERAVARFLGLFPLPEPALAYVVPRRPLKLGSGPTDRGEPMDVERLKQVELFEDLPDESGFFSTNSQVEMLRPETPDFEQKLQSLVEARGF